MSGQDVVIAIVSAVVGAVISWLTSRHFHRLVHRPKLQVTSYCFPLLSAMAPQHVKVTMGDTAVPNPHVVEVIIRNNGVVDLRADAFDSALPLGIRFRGFKATEVINRGGSAPRASLKGAEVEVGPARLPRGQSWSFTLLGSGALVGQPMLRTNHLADTDIFDSEAELLRAVKFRQVSKILTYPGMGLFTLAFFLLLLSQGAWFGFIFVALIVVGLSAGIVGTIYNERARKIKDRVRGYKLPSFF